MKRPDIYINDQTYNEEVLNDYIDQLESEKSELQQYIKITVESFLEHGFKSDSIIMKQADKLLRF